MSQFINLTPFMHVPDIDTAVSFFTDILGFEKYPTQFDDYAYVYRETMAFRLLQNRGDDGAPPGNRRFAYYVDVVNIDRLYHELKPKLDLLPKGDVMGPIDQVYGQRELMIVAPDGNWLVFGAAINDQK